MRGKIVAAYNEGNVLWLWFSSPTGDSSDSHQFRIPCIDVHQAQEIAEYYHDVCDVPRYGADSEVTDPEERRLRSIVDRGLGYTL
jgi:hypothetical protein